MFAATPRWRDQLDARKVLFVALVALVAFVLQLALLAGTVASPLGGMIANLEMIPQVDVGPVPAYAEQLPNLRDGSLQLASHTSLDGQKQYCFVYR